jgi:hypothetical protein
MKSLSFFLLSMIFSVNIFAQSRTDALVGLEEGQIKQIRSNVLTATLRSAARLFEAKNDLTTVIMIIPSGSRVTVLDSDSTYYKVRFEDSEGYIFKRQALIDDPTLVSPIASTKETPNPVAEEPVEVARPVQQSTVSRFTYLENKYGTSVAARINSGKIWKGMNGEMVRDSWGNPQKISRVISNNTVEEEWTYKSTILYFQNNKLVQWGPVK